MKLREQPVTRMPSGSESETAANVWRRTESFQGVTFQALSSFEPPNRSGVLRDGDLNFVLGIERHKQEFQNGTTYLEETIRPLSAIQD